MDIFSQCSLLERNTFGIEAKADCVIDYDTTGELQDIILQRQSTGYSSPLLHIGGGSNLLFLSDFHGTILHSRIQGIEVTAEDDQYIYVRAGAGITWDEWVRYAVKNQWYGLENLSLIPGEVGASAVQNIGAYGSEAKDFITRVETIDLRTGEQQIVEASELHYGYRSSRFKTEWRGRYAVTSVHFRLYRNFVPHLDYGGLRHTLQAKGITPEEVTAQELRDIVIEVRRAKLPEPTELGNAGSFFTNPIVERSVYERIAKAYDEVPHYEVDASHVKIPAGWLIEKCGWKGRNLGPAGVYERQALILVNLGGAKGTDIAHLSDAIQKDVFSRFGISITPEVNFI